MYCKHTCIYIYIYTLIKYIYAYIYIYNIYIYIWANITKHFLQTLPTQYTLIVALHATSGFWMVVTAPLENWTQPVNSTSLKQSKALCHRPSSEKRLINELYVTLAWWTVALCRSDTPLDPQYPAAINYSNVAKKTCVETSFMDG